MIFRPATAEDLIKVDGKLPEQTCRAVIAEEDGRLLAVFGIYLHSTRWVLFSDFTDEFRANKRAMVKAVRSIMQLIGRRPAMPLMAEADPEIKGSDVLLKHMGFEQLNASIYQWVGKRQSLPSSL